MLFLKNILFYLFIIYLFFSKWNFYYFSNEFLLLFICLNNVFFLVKFNYIKTKSIKLYFNNIINIFFQKGLEQKTFLICFIIVENIFHLAFAFYFINIFFLEYQYYLTDRLAVFNSNDLKLFAFLPDNYIYINRWYTVSEKSLYIEDLCGDWILNNNELLTYLDLNLDFCVEIPFFLKNQLIKGDDLELIKTEVFNYLNNQLEAKYLEKAAIDKELLWADLCKERNWSTGFKLFLSSPFIIFFILTCSPFVLKIVDYTVITEYIITEIDYLGFVDFLD